MPTVIISSAVCDADDNVTVTGTVDGVAGSVIVPLDLLTGMGNAAAQKIYLAQRLQGVTAAMAATTADMSAVVGTVTL